MSRGWLIVFAKVPRAGLVKTRLSPPLSLEQAATFYDAMLADVLEASRADAEALGLDPVLAFHPADAVPEMLRRAPPGFRLQLQRGDGLADRMANAFAESEASGAPFAILRGSDSPSLSRATVADMVSRLESGADVVFTPDFGGGYAVVGQRRHTSALFDVAMSTERVLEETLALATQYGLRHATTDPVTDIDRVDDLEKFEAFAIAESSDRVERTVGAIADLRKSGVL